MIARVTAWIRSVRGRLWAAPARWVPELRDAALAQSRRRWIAWGVVAALLVLAPLAFNLARASRFEASVLLFPRAVPPFPAPTEPESYGRFLADPILLQQMRANVGESAIDDDAVTFERGDRPRSVRMTVAAGTPADAQRFVNALAPQIQGATQRRLALVADADEVAVRRRLKTRLSGRDRESLRRRLRLVSRFGPFPPPPVLPGAPATRPPVERWADQVVDDLPGDFYARPHPLWAALAGLLVTLILFVAALELAPPRERADPAPPL